MSIIRKLRRIKQRKKAQAESKLWTPDDWRFYMDTRTKLINDKVKREAASRKAYFATAKRIAEDATN